MIFAYRLLYCLQPVGALSPDRLKKFQERYSSFDDPVIPKFHYGSHYSSAGTVGFSLQIYSLHCFLALKLIVCFVIAVYMVFFLG